MKKRKLIPFFSMFLLAAGLLLAFNNCGKGQTADSLSSTFNKDINTYNAADICSEEEITVFSRGYHPFLSSTCKNCHVHGPGKGTFASSNLEDAFTAFKMLGYSKISQYAVNGSHNPPYSGSQNLEVISSYRLQWQTFLKEKSKCGDGSGNGGPSEIFVPLFETSTLPIPVIKSTTTGSTTVYERKTLSWDLQTSLAALGSRQVPNLTGVQLTVTISGMKLVTGETAYVFSLPTLKVGTQSLHVKGLNFRLNGFPISYATTFKSIDLNVYQSTTALLSPGSMVSVGPLGSQDTLSVQFGDLEPISLTAPPPPPKVQFAATAMRITADQLGWSKRVEVQVNVTGDFVEPISVPVYALADNQYPSTEKPAVGVIGAGMNRFDWDYQFDPTTPTSMILSPGQKTASFKIIFSDDLRDDVDKVLRLVIGSPLGADVGTNSVLRIELPDLNPAYAGSAPTFAQLMRSGRNGILGVYCVKCHNSVQKLGGYDMTNYQDMVDRGVIVPGNKDPNQHKMYRRMNPDAPGAEKIQSMPLDNWLPKEERDLVIEWILDGAKNN